MSLQVKRKFLVRSQDEVRSVDIHPTKPWLIAGLYCLNRDDRGTINIYSLESSAIIHTYRVADVPVTRIIEWSFTSILCVRFIPRKDWFAASDTEGVIYVFNYNTHANVLAFKAHSVWVRCLTVHPSVPIILTGSDDMTIKAWDWDKQWRNIRTYKGHKNWITTIAFHPEDLDVFVSASHDGTIKMWSITSPVPESTIQAHNSYITCVGFYPGAEKPYLLTASSDKTIKVLDYKSQTCVQAMQGHTKLVNFAVFHPNLPMIISGSDDETVQIWDSGTYEIKHTLSYKLGWAWCIAFRKDTNQVAVGFNKGVAILELECSEPALDLYQQCTTLAMEIIGTKTLNKLVLELTDDEAQCVADFLNQMVNDEDAFTQHERKSTLHLLSKLAKSCQVFPRSLELEGVHCNLTNPVVAGGYGFIYKGEYQGNRVCVKAVQADSEGISEKKMRAHASELTIWAHILHPNVLPFVGIYASKEEAPRMCIVSPWMNNGDLLQYLKKVPAVPRKTLVRDIIYGLQYLHDFDIIHADLKASNVLVSETGRAMLTDFGISRLVMTHTKTSTNASAGTAYWMAPELLLGEDEPPSRESDVWAFACTCYEIITGTMPFSQYRNVPLLIAAFMKGKIIPSKPTPGMGWDEDVWSVAEQCWKSNPASRPRARDIRDMIKSFNLPDSHSSEPQLQRRGTSSIDYDRILNILNGIHQSPAV